MQKKWKGAALAAVKNNCDRITEGKLGILPILDRKPRIFLERILTRNPNGRFQETALLALSSLTAPFPLFEGKKPSIPEMA